MILFKKPGEKNTRETLEIAVKKAATLPSKKILVASTTGRSAKIALDIAPDDLKIVTITHHTGFEEPDIQEFDEGIKKLLEERGHRVLTATHALSAGERCLRKKFGGIYPLEIIANTLRMFSEGVKVAVEISLMAADAGLVKTAELIVACGGTGSGLDSAVVIKPANSSNLFDLRIVEILCMPQNF
ncbi:pyruvate kinase alpha/beta domain-containing protein [Thermotoga sp. KOL6]|uniref:pyruvate kinase alpha/beta domain-containing protein n=1 Tax=Thermotoga sp. KOL6 TaxID=126741 RepID=UPI000C7729A5|nr:pyruvate kinase alpha/beta domain-containing protein [Thermotoga sp. KOL6]PLV58364.1 hypothetical protein AS005_08350 [Thermotoga sp. KOL6]